jgi:protein required for attachment to host cells
MMRRKMTLEFPNRIRYYLIANRLEANIYRSAPGVQFKFLERLKNDSGRLMESDLDSDSPGTGWSSAGSGTIRHSLDRTFHHHEKVLLDFSKKISDYLDHASLKDQFGELVLVCEPHFLGVLRSVLSARVKKLIRYEINREYLQGSDQEIYKMILRAMASRSEIRS